MFLAGDNKTRCGVCISEEVFVQFIKMCPGMRLMRLESHTSLGQDILLAILESYPKIEALHISGHDRSHGRIDDKALTAITATCDMNLSLGIKLQDLTLHDQSVYEKGIKKLQKAAAIHKPTTYAHAVTAKLYREALKHRLDLNLEVEISIKAKVNGDITLSLLISLPPI
ncbi:hypothetical protein IW262DRAFT_1465419 [Armillaria fumosa]|nr:hypothetical protein IW262DRAFT_1465419 [Armillaria fumosa]